MDQLLQQIQDGLHAKLYLLSLMAALAIPDICGAVDALDGQASKNNYIKWFDKYLAPKYQKNLDGSSCYLFRCSLVHQGTSQHPKSHFSRIMFLEPNKMLSVHNSTMNDVLFIDVNNFCNDVIDAYTEWRSIVESTHLYKQNIQKFIQRYPDGLRPYISGLPVIG